MNTFIQPKALNPAIKNTGESSVDDYNGLLLINLYDTSVVMPTSGNHSHSLRDTDSLTYSLTNSLNHLLTHSTALDPSVDSSANNMSVVTRHLIDRVGSDPDAKLEKISNLILKMTNIFAANMRHDLTVDLIQVLIHSITSIRIHLLVHKLMIVSDGSNE